MAVDVVARDGRVRTDLLFFFSLSFFTLNADTTVHILQGLEKISTFFGSTFFLSFVDGGSCEEFSIALKKTITQFFKKKHNGELTNYRMRDSAKRMQYERV